MCIRPCFATYMIADASEVEPPTEHHASQVAGTSHVGSTPQQETASNGSAPAVVPIAIQIRRKNVEEQRLVLRDQIDMLKGLMLALENEERRMSGGRLSRWRDLE